jgi:hypothetical protein
MRTVLLAALAAAAGPAFAGSGNYDDDLGRSSRGVSHPGSPGGTLQIGKVGTTPDSNGFVGVSAQLVDEDSKLTYYFFLEARETSIGPGGSAGDLTFNVLGPGLTACSVRGGSARLYAGGTAFNHGGIDPSRSCGTAYGQSVYIEGCKATLQAHGFAHADDPNVNHWGATTIDVRYEKKPAGYGRIHVTLHTPDGRIELGGKVVDDGGMLSMPSCP